MKTDSSAAPSGTHDAGVTGGIEDIYAEAEQWHVNTGNETIHAKRLPGKWRTIKWLAASVWLVFFLGPYLSWDGRQAVLFDIPNRQYHLFGVTVLPQDFWMLSLLLLFFAILLAVATALAGRVYCGYFCFQTVWTDVFTLIEEKLASYGIAWSTERLAEALDRVDIEWNRDLRHLLPQMIPYEVARQGVWARLA